MVMWGSLWLYYFAHMWSYEAIVISKLLQFAQSHRDTVKVTGVHDKWYLRLLKVNKHAIINQCYLSSLILTACRGEKFMI